MDLDGERLDLASDLGGPSYSLLDLAGDRLEPFLDRGLEPFLDRLREVRKSSEFSRTSLNRLGSGREGFSFGILTS